MVLVVHPFQKQACVLFISIAFVTLYISRKQNINNNSFKALYNLTNSSNTDIDEYLKLLELNNTDKFDDFFSENLTNHFITIYGNESTGNNSNVLYILGLFELTTKYGPRKEGSSEVQSAQLAVQHCDPGVGIDRFFHALYSKKKILMLLGTGCSNVTESLAHVMPYWNILQVSFGSTSPSLSDRTKFPLFFRTVAPDSSYTQAKIHFIKKIGWKVVATFSQSENAYLLPLNHLVTELEKVNVTCISTVTFSLDNYKEQLKVVKEHDIRIIFASFSTEMSAKIFCAIYEMNMFGHEYVWILQDRNEVWWRSNQECSQVYLEKATEGIIIVSDFSNMYQNEYAISGLNEVLFKESLNVTSHISKYAKQTYDAIWAMALSLRKYQEYSYLDVLNKFHYKRKDMVRVYLLSAGCSLTFGSMFAKTYRVHRLFTYIGAGLVKDKLLKDKKLIALIFIPLIIDGIILSLWSLVDPMHRNLYNLTLQISQEDSGVVYQPQVEICKSQNTYGWYIALYGYKALFLVMGVFMAWETRHVKIPSLNDSQYIGICVYSAVFSAIIVVLSSFISEYVVFSYIARSVSILTSTTVTLFLLFLPKLKSVFGTMDSVDPIMQSMGLKMESNTRRFITNDPNEIISRLEIQNKVYRYELEALDKEIAALEERINCLNSYSTINIDLSDSKAQCYYLKVPSPNVARASWPNTRGQLSIHKSGFHSDVKLNKDSFFDRLNIFGRLKHIFGSSSSSLELNEPQLEQFERSHVVDYNLQKALSENNIHI
ncbi:unnamed protein product [Brassicogethes aeneus]|uniref:Gamma-aminobutyric acid type B receptor subunit 2 n=1 Tax=Brassicogethes aeneus TaxID=1431903 RepID=A0A9P0FMW7_BRAAE|nr:unnamed protein product [Brassicogethes aeneus]